MEKVSEHGPGPFLADIRMTMAADGAMVVTGMPLNLMQAYGMLEIAKDIAKNMVDQAQRVEAAGLVSPTDADRFRFGKRGD